MSCIIEYILYWSCSRWPYSLGFAEVPVFSASPPSSCKGEDTDCILSALSVVQHITAVPFLQL